MASLYQDQRTGLYYAQFCDKTRRPRLKQVPLGTRTQRVAERLFSRVVDQHALGAFDPWAPPQEPPREELQVGEAVRLFVAAHQHLSPSTVAKYRSVLGLFEQYVGSGFPTSRISVAHVQGFLDGGSRKAITRKTYATTMSPFFNWLIERGDAAENPVAGLKLARVPQKFPRFLSPADVERLVRAVEEDGGENRHAQEGTSRWLIPIIRTNVYLGLRAGEIVNLKWEQVDLERRTLRVANADDFRTKSGRERTLPLCRPVVEVLAALGRTSPYVFPSFTGQRLGRQYVSRRFKYFARRAGLPPEINLHATRHTAASWLAQSGCSVEAIRLYMGHSSITVSQRYMHLAPDALRDQVEAAFDAMEGAAAGRARGG